MEREAPLFNFARGTWFVICHPSLWVMGIIGLAADTSLLYPVLHNSLLITPVGIGSLATFLIISFSKTVFDTWWYISLARMIIAITQKQKIHYLLFRQALLQTVQSWWLVITTAVINAAAFLPILLFSVGIINIVISICIFTVTPEKVIFLAGLFGLFLISIIQLFVNIFFYLRTIETGSVSPLQYYFALGTTRKFFGSFFRMFFFIILITLASSLVHIMFPLLAEKFFALTIFGEAEEVGFPFLSALMKTGATLILEASFVIFYYRNKQMQTTTHSS
ncbi:MAG: hypothetical protein JW725_03205 [Candidatus Babeliaceae bacterium]|nr:hypothetical protein [Candidatus Babeliaceae bacterium]